MPRLQDKGVIVTGASVGLGNAIARACLREGASVYLCARSPGALDAARAALVDEFGPSRVRVMAADVSDPVAVSALIDTAAHELPNVVGLVNNAGVVGPIGLLEETDWAEWRRTVEINLFGAVLCSGAILPAFRSVGYGKIVNLSGGGATGPRPRLSAYAASKAAVVRFTETIAAEYAEYHIDVNAIAPGALNTRMLHEGLAAGPLKVGRSEYEALVRQRETGGSSLARAADLCVFLLSKESDGITGRLISAVWDPWESLAERAEQLRDSDIFTLRRIVPKDRGRNWE